MKPSIKSYIMWILALTFFGYQFIFRLIPGLIINEIRDKFSIDATSFGLLSSMYYFGYAGMQIPIAILLDKYGPKYVISICVAICSISNLAFVVTDNWAITLFGRFAIGAGSAVGFLGVSKIISLYFPSNYYGRMIALSFTFGLIGALYGGRPLNNLLEISGWQNILQIVSIVGIILSILIFILVENPIIKYDPNIVSISSTNQLFKIVSNPHIILLAIANLLMVGPLEGFADIWGVSYLVKVYNLKKADASVITSSIFLGMIFGGPILNFIVDKFNNHARILALCGIIMAIGFTIMLTGVNYLTYSHLNILMFFIGIICCYQIVIFSYNKNLVTPDLQGMSVAFLNCINMLGGSFFHTMIGLVMDISSEDFSKKEDYSSGSFTYALSIIPLACFIGGMIFIYLGKINSRFPESKKEAIIE